MRCVLRSDGRIGMKGYAARVVEWLGLCMIVNGSLKGCGKAQIYKEKVRARLE